MKPMRNLLQLPLFVAFLFSFTLTGQEIPEESGLPGDHFSLEGALELFKQSSSPENFEKLLNSEDNYVNNLDLNEDGDIDYIRVIDNMDGDVHAIVLQVPVNAKESQDIAVIEIEKTGKEDVMLQIVGNEIIYGEETIVEPYEVKESGGKGGPGPGHIRAVIFNVWAWPCVRFIYRPTYRIWVSPFRWAYYPKWWRPWRPRPWKVFYPRVAVYRPRYRVVTTHRVVRAHKVYTPVRRTSNIVHTRTKTTVVKGKNGTVVSRKKTTAAKATPSTGRKKTTTTTVAKSKNGKVKAGKKTTTTKKYNGKTNTTKKKRTTTTGVKRSKNGAAVGKRSTTVTRKKKG